MRNSHGSRLATPMMSATCTLWAATLANTIESITRRSPRWTWSPGPQCTHVERRCTARRPKWVRVRIWERGSWRRSGRRTVDAQRAAFYAAARRASSPPPRRRGGPSGPIQPDSIGLRSFGFSRLRPESGAEAGRSEARSNRAGDRPPPLPGRQTAGLAALRAGAWNAPPTAAASLRRHPPRPHRSRATPRIPKFRGAPVLLGPARWRSRFW